MKLDTEKLDNVFEQKRLECKADHVPCTVQTTYANLDGKQDHLLRRELKLLDSKRVVIGVEYDEEGNPAEVYTENKDGKRVKLSLAQETRQQTLPNLIEERLKIVSKTISKEDKTISQHSQETTKENTKTPRKKITTNIKNIFTSNEKRA